MALTEGKSLVNVALVEIVTDEDTPKTYQFDTSESLEMEPKVSDGEEKIHRIKNRVLATNKTEDIVIGYDLKLTDSTMNAEVLALVEGGTVTYAEGTEDVVKYEGPAMGSTIVKVPFSLNVYTEEKDESGDVVEYAKFSFCNCKGKPTKYSMKDNDFFMPEFEIESRAKKGEKPVTINFMSELPS